MNRLLPLLLVASLGWTADEDYRAAAPANQRPMLGIEMTPVPSHIQEREGLNPHQGVLVQSTYAGTAAEAMALQHGDVVLNVNGAPITTMGDLRNEVGLTAVGDPIQVTVVRDGQTLELSAEVREWPAAIPYEKLDAASEKRFRDWQDRRNARQAQELARLKQEAEDLRRELAGEATPKGGRKGRAGSGDGSSAEGMPAVRFRVVVEASSATIAADDGPEPTDLAPLALPAGLPANAPWTVSARLTTL